MSRPLLALTMGDVNGIGPEVLAKALARKEAWGYCTPLVVGDSEALTEAADFAGVAIPPITEVSSCGDARSLGGHVALMDGGFAAPIRRPGAMDPEAGRCAVEWIKHATRLAINREIDGLVTCPISKACIYQAGYTCTGHTDLIAEMCGTEDYRMCLFTETMRIVHITAHLSLRDALAEVRAPRIERSIRIGHEALRRMGFAQPRIAVAGLNPHAGEAGKFGCEEIEDIAPAVAACRAEGIDCTGPWPPDTLFGKMRDGLFDMVIAMYHDQGHIPLKLIAMDEGVNVTLGIPIVRTSVDHGTAYDIAGQGIAREHSLIAAIRLAAQLTGQGNHR